MRFGAPSNFIRAREIIIVRHALVYLKVLRVVLLLVVPRQTINHHFCVAVGATQRGHDRGF